MPYAHTDNSFTMKIIFEEKLATKNDEETNNNVSANSDIKSLNPEECEHDGPKVNSPPMKERTQRMSLEIYCG